MNKEQYYKMKMERDKEAARRAAIIEKDKVKAYITAPSVHTHISECSEKQAKRHLIGE